MVSRRVILNLFAFLGLFLLLCWWAVRNVIAFDFIERPYSITAEFETSPGLRPEFEVTYLGVRVGSIDAVDLVGDRVVVRLDIERGTDLPEDMSAAVRRKSAVGEPYVDLAPPDGYEGGGPFIDAGYVVPLERTSTPLSYAELFVSLDRLVDAVPGEALNTLVHELAVALDGRGPAIRTLVESASDLTGTLAERTELLDELTTELTRLTHTISEHRDDLGSTFDDVAALADTLAANAADVDAVLTRGPEFLGQVADLLDASSGDLSCTVEALAPIAASLGEQERLDLLVRLLRSSREAAAAILDARVETGEMGADGPYLNGAFEFNLGGAQAPIYDEPAVLPYPPTVPECAAGGVVVPGAAGDGSVASGGQVPEGEAGTPPDVSDRPAPATPDLPATSEREVDPGFEVTDLLRPVLLVAALLIFVFVVGTRVWPPLSARWRRKS